MKAATRSQTKKRAKTISDERILEGLVLSRDGEYVKLDNKLLKRLRPVEEEVERQNPFENHPNFMKTLCQGTPITLDFLQECSQIVKSDPDAVKMAEMVGNIPVDWLALKRSKMLENNWDYNIKLPINPKTTNQGYSGRCWAMAGYNNLRIPLMRKFNLEDKFEFSEAYLFFYDKIERSNMFLEYMWTLRDRDLEDRDVRSFTNPSSHFTSDGGYFTYFVNLVSKYGLVPKNVYDEGYNSMVSTYLNNTLSTVLNHMSLDIFRNKDIWSREDFEEQKKKYMLTVYDLVVRFLGEPPKPNDKFTWTFKSMQGESHKIPNLTPESFYRTMVPHNHESKIVIINDPRHPETYFMSSWSPYSLNMQGGTPINMINLPMDVFKKVICESLKNEDSVWFASDISKCFDTESDTSDPNRFDYKAVLGTDIEFDKADMLEMQTAVPNHALLFIGVDTIEDQQGNINGYKKWRIENSWGKNQLEEDAKDFGYYRMSDDYVNQYVFEAAVDLKYFDQDIMEKILENANSGKTFTYSPYDAFGAMSLKSECRHCSSHHSHKRSTFKN